VGMVVKLVGAGVLAVAAVASFALGYAWPGVACAAATVAVIAWVALTLRLPPLRVKQAALTVTLEGADGRRARVVKTQELVPLRKPLGDIRDRSLFTPGRLDDIEVSPGAVAERMGLGKYHITKVVFKPPLPPGRPVNRTMSYVIYDGFAAADVAFMFVGDYPTDELALTVVFPPERRPHRARVFVRAPGRPDKPAEVTRAPDGSSLGWRLTDVKVGVQYHIEWSW